MFMHEGLYVNDYAIGSITASISTCQPDSNRLFSFESRERYAINDTITIYMRTSHYFHVLGLQTV